MSRRRQRPPQAGKVSEKKRQQVARKIAQDFNSLNPDQQRIFVDETLTALVNMKKKQMQKLFGKFVKRGRPSTQDLETINQLIVVFLHSVKTEFRYHYASMIYKSLNMALPPDIPKKLGQVRKYKWLHFGVSPKTYDVLFKDWEKRGRPDYDTFFTVLVEGAQSVERKVATQS